MADSILEVEEITSISSSLAINIGTLNNRLIKSMVKAGIKSNEIAIPSILDPVGVGASKLRMDATFQLMEEVQFSVVSGNVSEIKTIYKKNGTTSGVDANKEDEVVGDNLDDMVDMCKKLSKQTGAIISMTGAIDIIADSTRANIIYNGNPLMTKISGTGCMLTTLIAAYCGANPDHIFEATSMATLHMGVAGDLAFEKLEKIKGGTSSYKMLLLDSIYQIDYKDLEEVGKIETR